jgi:hypothetical protein
MLHPLKFMLHTFLPDIYRHSHRLHGRADDVTLGLHGAAHAASMIIIISYEAKTRQWKSIQYYRKAARTSGEASGT